MGSEMCIRDRMTDPIHGSKAHGMNIEGIVSIHVDDSFMCGTGVFSHKVIKHLLRSFKLAQKTQMKFNLLDRE